MFESSNNKKFRLWNSFKNSVNQNYFWIVQKNFSHLGINTQGSTFWSRKIYEGVYHVYAEYDMHAVVIFFHWFSLPNSGHVTSKFWIIPFWSTLLECDFGPFEQIKIDRNHRRKVDQNSNREFLTPQAQLSLQGTFFSFLIMLNSELCAWGVKSYNLLYILFWARKLLSSITYDVEGE